MHIWLPKRYRPHKRRLALAVAGAAALTAALAAGPAHASVAAVTAAVPALTVNTDAPCNVTLRPGFARCFAVVRTVASHSIASSASGQPPATALGPADIQSAYHLPSLGAGQTVAIVDANGDSQAEADLATFRAQYGLSPCTTANGCFRKVDQAGGTNYPPDDPSWGLETSLDLDAVSSACPKCSILLVEANSASFPDLSAAVNEAVALGAKFVSNSYGAPDGSGTGPYESAYDHPGAAIVASSGDAGNAVEWPSANPNVTSVGGTLLMKDATVSRGWDETAWHSGGSGCSTVEPQPDYQVGVTTDCTMRATADISADADPASGLATYDTLGQNGWMQVGGTSLASPLITAMYAMAGTPVPGTYPVSYVYHDPKQSADLFDVTQGSNGACGNVLCNAGPGWDGPTGLGTPDGLGALSSGPQSVITGQVTDATTGKPITGGIVTTSPGNYQTRTDANGNYQLDVTAGNYTVSGSAYAYQTATDSVQAAADQTVTANLSLAELPHTILSGTVKDGSGHGWPVYARLTIGGGYPGGPVYTDPFTGKYSVELAASATYPITISAAGQDVDLPAGEGYQTLSTQVTAGTSPQMADFALNADKTACTATGYGYLGLNENFTSWTGTTPRDGWTVTGSRDGWRFDNPGNRPPPTMTTGNNTFAIADSGTSGGHMDSTLTSPAVDLSGQRSPVLRFQTEYYGAPGQQGTIELSTDGGSTWTPLWHRTTGNAVSIDPYTTIAIPAAAGKHDVRVRFRYTGDDSWWWTVGNVHIGDPGCTALPGGVVTGLVTDAGTAQAIAGATVTSPARAATSIATETGDPGVTGALYSVFSPATGSQSFTAAAAGYGSSTASVNVTADQLTRQDFALTASAHAAAHVGTAPASPVSPARTASAPAGQLQPATLPGLRGRSYTITLITGDQVSLTATGPGRYLISATPSPAGGDQYVHVTEITNRKGSTTLQAMPSLATPLMAGGEVDPGMFELAWLATHGDTGSGATLPVVLRSAAPAGATAMARKVATLPGVKVTGVSAAAGTVQVTVRASHAAAFWAAITGTRAPQPGKPATSLADGIAGIWLAGHRTAAASPQLSADQPLYTVTETILTPPPSSGLEACGGNVSVCLSSRGFGLFSVSGAEADNNFPATSVTCASQAASGMCTAYRVTYRVPVGVYTGQGWGDMRQGPDLQFIDLTVPQLTVAGDTNLTVDLGKARKLTVSTPRPGDSVSLATDSQAVTPDGTLDVNATVLFYGYQNAWVVQAGDPVTTGTFHYSTRWVRQAPIITMSAAGTALHPYYPYYIDDPALTPFKRFTGSQTLQLVDAGTGSAGDFSHINARGKLAFISLDPVVGGCLVEGSQLTNALNAGAAGVIVDPTIPPGVKTSGISACPMPIDPDWWSNGSPMVRLPYVSMPQADAQHLRKLLAAGPVSINVTDYGNPGYLYNLALYSEGHVPTDPSYTVTAHDLAPVSTTLHDSAPSTINWTAFAYSPDERFIFIGDTMLHTQATQTQYFGPISPAEAWLRDAVTQDGAGQLSAGVFRQDNPTTDDWFSQPTAPGAAQVTHALTDAQPGLWQPSAVCAFCRQGDVFYPFYYQASQDPKVQDGIYTIDPSQAHLYAGGQEIQPTTVGGYPAYNLPSGKASYRFTMTAGNTTTDWTYSSATPTANQTPDAYGCAGTALINSTAPCAPTALILLRYNAFVSPGNSVTADGPHQIEVTPDYQEGSSPATITSLRLWISTDGGTTWQEVHVTAHDGSYTGRYQLPALSATNGSVSIKAQATDSADTTVSQTVLNAYSISG